MKHELVLKAKHYHDPFTVFVVDTANSKWFGEPINQLGAYGRRRFENWVILERPTQRLKIVYGYH